MSKNFSIFKILENRLGNLKLKNDTKLSLKIVNVYLENKPKDKLDIYIEYE